ncbi:hypothetical protein AJ79_05809 [Helicocarpus griseus UAMH5409]|uniref:DUF7728 domain-containing protein n=1 Tax=Helicocarpus griseus UAMH5409 TaxID=1447875 RepID=A0A2B7XBI8_9EURO|nr:hypothetical protein AJ79_05809 [Helicocarpus griseus UAMH5409]
MMLPSLVAATTLALPASAFLLTAPAFRYINGEPHELDDSNLNQLELSARCVECPFPRITDEPRVVWEDKSDSQMYLNFTTDGDTLSMNGGQVYPMLVPPSELETVLHRQSDGKTSFPLPVGYVFERLSPSPPADDSGAELLIFNFMVIDVAGYPVPVDSVSLRVVQLPNGHLFMAGADVEKTTPRMSWRQCRRKPKCLKNLVFARIRSILESAKARAIAAASKLKGCGKNPFKGFTAPASSSDEKPSAGSNSDSGSGFHGSSVNGYSHALRVFVVPTLLGLSAGLFASVVGIIIGHGVAALWVRYRRASSARNYERVESGDDVEKEPLYVPESDELPPQYEDEDYGNVTLPAEKE